MGARFHWIDLVSEPIPVRRQFHLTITVCFRNDLGRATPRRPEVRLASRHEHATELFAISRTKGREFLQVANACDRTHSLGLCLIDRRTARAYEARVTGIKAPDFGLTFVDAYRLNVQLPRKLQFLIVSGSHSVAAGQHRGLKLCRGF